MALQGHGKSRIRRYALLNATRNLLKVDFTHYIDNVIFKKFDS